MRAGKNYLSTLAIGEPAVPYEQPMVVNKRAMNEGTREFPAKVNEPAVVQSKLA